MEKKYVLIPDSFKGTLSSAQVCKIMEEAIIQFEPNANIVKIPIADGGEGSVDAFLAALGGEKVAVAVKDPWGREVDSFYGKIGDMAVVELAAAAGLGFNDANCSVEKANTYGVGQLIAHAISSGAKKIIVGLGGSATNDGGCGAAYAMGARFFDRDGKAFVPSGGSLSDIYKIDLSLFKRGSVEIITMCDVNNPLCGENGAAAVFGPQKGADTKTIRLLDDGLRNLAQVIKKDLGKDIADVSGAGAAGGMGAGMMAFFNSKLQMGIEVIMDIVGFDEKISDADFIFTGEGKLDYQSLQGKVVIGIAKRARKSEVPVIAVVGSLGKGGDKALDAGVTAIFVCNKAALPFEKVKATAKEDLTRTMCEVMQTSVLKKL